MKSLSLAIFCFVLSSLTFSTAYSADAFWRIQKDRWSDTDERAFSGFIQAIGESRCRTLDQCLKSSANPYRDTDPAGATYTSDCADLPYILRAYFAWKNRLPFSMISDVTPVEPGSDLRYSAKGNRVSGRRDVVARATGQLPNATQVLKSINGTVSSAMFRLDPRNDDSRLFADFYSVKLSRETLVPGTAIYDPNGHVAVVYKVESDGRVLFVDAHPERLPTNIYGTSGEWEECSTPSRDARLKTSFKEMRDRVEEFVKLAESGSPRVVDSGQNIKADLLAVYEDVARSCAFEYRKSDGALRTVSLDGVLKRLFKLSFDPYHCIELRWGETDPAHLASCGDDSVKRRWYQGEQYLRNQIDRTYDARMDFDLGEVSTLKPGNGVGTAPDVDVVKFLKF